MSSIKKLKEARDRKELAALLGFKPSSLTSIIYKTPQDQKYIEFKIPKKNGGERLIKAPNDKLKKLQTHLAHILYNCLAEIEAERKATPVSYGFRKDSSIADNAKNHKRRRYVLNLDLEDFFPSFNFGRVRGFFLKDKCFELNEEVATTIAQIACDGSALPQGSPCSPIISELIGQILDFRLLRLAKKWGVKYSRYADDITFSTNQKEFPTALAIQNSEDLKSWTLGSELVNKITASGFTINQDKTRMNCRGSRQTVTGLVVNEKVNINSVYYRKARAMCDSLFQAGQYYCSFLPSEGNEEELEPDITSNLNPLEGILSYIYAITQTEERRSLQEQRQKPRAIRALYRRFLFYKYCIALDAPLIITEGKTDPAYLKEAIKSRKSFHPHLGQPDKEGFKFAIKFFNYESQNHEIMDLGGGTGDLKSVALDYMRNIESKKSRRKPFQNKPLKFPVILLLDNDSGLSDVAGFIKKNFGIQITKNSKDDFYYIRDNLYIIKTPETNGDSCIEDMFPKNILKTKLKNKKLSLKSKINPEKEYSKEVFAKSVIIPNSSKIDFSGFEPLLNRIIAVLNHYSPP